MLVWVRLANHETLKRYNPLQEMVPIGSLAISPSPTRRELALRFVIEGQFSPPALSDPRHDIALRLLTPDDDARIAWLEALLVATTHELDGSLSRPPEASSGGPALRPTRLPAPGELEESHPTLARLRRLAGYGRLLGDELAGSHVLTANQRVLLDETRLVFANFPILTDDPAADYAPALAALDAFQRHADSPDERLRLLGLRAQIQMARLEFPRAEAILAHLREANAHAGRRIEETARGPVLEPTNVSGGWPQILSSRLDDLKQGRSTPVLLIGPGFGNPDAPQPGLGLDPIVPNAPPDPIPQPPPFQFFPGPIIRLVPDDPRPPLPPALPGLRIRILPPGNSDPPLPPPIKPPR